MTRRDVLKRAAAPAIAGSLAVKASAQIALLGKGLPYSSALFQANGHGDSYALGVGVATPVAQLLSSQLIVSNNQPNNLLNVGWNGQGFLYVYPTSGSPDTLVQDLSVSILPNLSLTRPNWLWLFTDGNDFAIGGYTVAQSYAAFQTYCATAIAGGIPASRILVWMMGVRKGCSQSLITAWNSALLGDAGGIGYKLIRNDLDPLIGTAGNFNDATYFQQTGSPGIHLTELGYSIGAQIAAPVVSPER